MCFFSSLTVAVKWPVPAEPLDDWHVPKYYDRSRSLNILQQGLILIPVQIFLGFFLITTSSLCTKSTLFSETMLQVISFFALSQSSHFIWCYSLRKKNSWIKKIEFHEGKSGTLGVPLLVCTGWSLQPFLIYSVEYTQLREEKLLVIPVCHWRHWNWLHTWTE